MSSVSETNQYKLLNVPIKVSTQINTVVKDKDFSSDIDVQSFSNVPASEQIKIVSKLGSATLTLNMGSENYLESVERSGGDTDGGNVEATYNYSNYNTFSIS